MTAGCAPAAVIRAFRRRSGEAIFAVRQDTLQRSRMSMRAREVLIRQFVREQYGAEVAVPCSETLRLVWREWFGPGGARQRYQRSAALAAGGQHVVVHRPGQVVALDTTILPVKVRESVFGEPVSVHLTLALDAYSHSLVAFRLTMVSDSSVGAWASTRRAGTRPATTVPAHCSPRRWARAVSRCEIPAPELFYELLPACFVKIHGQRGVKIRGLWYDGPALDDYRDEPSSRSGRTGAGGRSTAIPAMPARSSSRTRSPICGSRSAGAGSRRKGRCPPSVTRACAICFAPPGGRA